MSSRWPTSPGTGLVAGSTDVPDPSRRISRRGSRLADFWTGPSSPLATGQGAKQSLSLPIPASTSAALLFRVEVEKSPVRHQFHVGLDATFPGPRELIKKRLLLRQRRASALRRPSSQSINRSVAFGPPQDPASDGDQTNDGPFDGPRLLCIGPPPSMSCAAKLDNQFFGRRAA